MKHRTKLSDIDKFRPVRFFWPTILFLFGLTTLNAVPNQVTDLSIRSSGFRHITLQWTAPGGPEGAPQWYEVRVSSYRVIVAEADWTNNSTSISYPYRIKFSTSTSSSNSEMRVVSSLVNNITYFFAIKSSTDNINWSLLDTSSPEPQSATQNNSPGNVSGYNYTGTPTTVVFSSLVFLAWGDVTNAGGFPVGTDNIYGDSITSYILWYSTASNFSPKSVVENITQTNWTTPALNENTTYYWRVYARDSEGLLSLGVTGTPQFVVNATSESPTAFSLIQPINDTIETGTLQPTLWWNASSDPDPADFVVYNVYISTSISFESNVSTRVSGINQLSWSPWWNLTENARYFWKVHARDTTGRETVSSSTGSFRLNTVNEPPQPFSLLWPTGGTMIFTSSPTLRWSIAIDLDPGNTVYYGISYSSTTATPAPPVIFDILTTYYQLIDLQEDAVYWWRVVARSSPDNLTTQSEISSFTVKAVNFPPGSFNLLASSGIIRTQTLSLSWQSAIDPDGDTVTYSIFYSSVSNFSIFVSSVGISSPPFSVTTSLNENTTYWWYVIAIDSFNAMTHSSTWFFIVDATSENPKAFSLLSPLDGSFYSYLKPTLLWQETTDPDPYDYVYYYTLTYSTNSLFAIKTQISPIYITSYTFQSDLSNNTTYYWYVTAHSTLTGSTDTLSRSFIAVNLPPNPFVPVSPSGIISTRTPTLIWSPSSDPESDTFWYDVHYSSYENFNVFVSSVGITTTSYITLELKENGTYWWRAVACDIWGNQRWSSVLSFKVNSIEENPSAFSLLSPANGAIIETLMPNFSWSSSFDPDPEDFVVYELWHSTSPDFSSRKVVSNIASLSYQVPLDKTLLVDSTYYWRVYAVDKTSRSTPTTDWSFYTNPSARPLPPTNFKFDIPNTKDIVLSWTAPIKNTDGSSPGNLAGFRVYVAHRFDDLFTSNHVAFVPASSSTLTLALVSDVNIYYMVRAINTLGVLGEPSAVLVAGEPNQNIHHSENGKFQIVAEPEILRPDYSVKITKKENPPDDQKTKLSYMVEIMDREGALIKTGFKKPLTLKFQLENLTASSPAVSKTPSEVASYAVFWFNGVEWVNLGGRYLGAYLIADARYSGEFRVRSLQRAVEFKILNAWPKVFTPNGDGINDEFNVTFENPFSESVTGEIFDLSGYKVAEMEKKSDLWVVWNGKEQSGGALPTGVYIYQLKVGDKIKNGTVVVAR